MKRKLKLALASVCVVAAGFGGMKVYNAANQSEADLLLAENVEALSGGEGVTIVCGTREHKGPCWQAGPYLKFCKEYSYYKCFATGDPHDYCVEPC